jgi:hypothetical protein
MDNVVTNVREKGYDEQMLNTVPHQKFQSWAHNTGNVLSKLSDCESEKYK